MIRQSGQPAWVDETGSTERRHGEEASPSSASEQSSLRLKGLLVTGLLALVNYALVRAGRSPSVKQALPPFLREPIVALGLVMVYLVGVALLRAYYQNEPKDFSSSFGCFAAVFGLQTLMLVPLAWIFRSGFVEQTCLYHGVGAVALGIHVGLVQAGRKDSSAVAAALINGVLLGAVCIPLAIFEKELLGILNS